MEINDLRERVAKLETNMDHVAETLKDVQKAVSAMSRKFYYIVGAVAATSVGAAHALLRLLP